MQKRYTCRFCGLSSDDLDNFEPDLQHHAGFWCPDCDGFTYFQSETKNHNFKLILETPGETSVSKKKLPFKTQVSPLRWPGGKSRLVGQILERCNPEKMENFIEPFAGGASVGLSLLLSGRVKNLFLNDLDYGVYSLFQTIRTKPEELLRRIKDFIPAEEAYKQSQKILQKQYKDLSMEEAAWHLLVVNRLAFSGIPKANCLKDICSRWSPNTLLRRIEAIHAKKDNIFVSNEDACTYIEEMYWKKNATLFIDPPYKVKGKDLYMEYYQEKDHEKLALLLEDLYKGMPGADMILTYDNCEYIRELYECPDVEEIRRNYTIAR